MEEELQKRLDAQDQKLDAIYKEMLKTRKYATWRLIITIAVIVIPLIGLSFVIPAFLNSLPNLSSFGL